MIKYDNTLNNQPLPNILTHLSGGLLNSPLCPALPSTVLRWRVSFWASSLSLLLLMKLNMAAAAAACCGSTTEGICVFWERERRKSDFTAGIKALSQDFRNANIKQHVRCNSSLLKPKIQKMIAGSHTSHDGLKQISTRVQKHEP